MQITNIQIHLIPENKNNLLGFAVIEFDHCFIIKDVKILNGSKGMFVGMPSKKICDRCPKCHSKNPLISRFCGNCAYSLGEYRHDASSNPSVHADIAHPVTNEFRLYLEELILNEYNYQLQREKECPTATANTMTSVSV